MVELIERSLSLSLSGSNVDSLTLTFRRVGESCDIVHETQIAHICNPETQLVVKERAVDGSEHKPESLPWRKLFRHTDALTDLVRGSAGSGPDLSVVVVDRLHPLAGAVLTRASLLSIAVSDYPIMDCGASAGERSIFASPLVASVATFDTTLSQPADWVVALAIAQPTTKGGAAAIIGAAIASADAISPLVPLSVSRLVVVPQSSPSATAPPALPYRSVAIALTRAIMSYFNEAPPPGSIPLTLGNCLVAHQPPLCDNNQPENSRMGGVAASDETTSPHTRSDAMNDDPTAAPVAAISAAAGGAGAAANATGAASAANTAANAASSARASPSTCAGRTTTSSAPSRRPVRRTGWRWAVAGAASAHPPLVGVVTAVAPAATAIAVVADAAVPPAPRPPSLAAAALLERRAALAVDAALIQTCTSLGLFCLKSRIGTPLSLTGDAVVAANMHLRPSAPRTAEATMAAAAVSGAFLLSVAAAATASGPFAASAPAGVQSAAAAAATAVGGELAADVSTGVRDGAGGDAAAVVVVEAMWPSMVEALSALATTETPTATAAAMTTAAAGTGTSGDSTIGGTAAAAAPLATLVWAPTKSASVPILAAPIVGTSSTSTSATAATADQLPPNLQQQQWQRSTRLLRYGDDAWSLVAVRAGATGTPTPLFAELRAGTPPCHHSAVSGAVMSTDPRVIVGAMAALGCDVALAVRAAHLMLAVHSWTALGVWSALTQGADRPATSPHRAGPAQSAAHPAATGDGAEGRTSAVAASADAVARGLVAAEVLAWCAEAELQLARYTASLGGAEVVALPSVARRAVCRAMADTFVAHALRAFARSGVADAAKALAAACVP